MSFSGNKIPFIYYRIVTAQQREVRIKKEKQLWTSHRCFPGCVLEVVCLIRRTKIEMVAFLRKILVCWYFSSGQKSQNSGQASVK
jgi:hypothetical protein